MSLVLRGVDYGPVQSASGAQGWFGEGYWFHDYIPGLRWKGCTFVSKTTTLGAREGNMPFFDTEIVKRRKYRFRPMERFPKCIIVKPWHGVVLNSVGLSGPGAKALFETGEWQRREEPFFLSFMSIAGTKFERMQEAVAFADLLRHYKDGFQVPFGLQINLSCPNTGHDTREIAVEARDILEIFADLRREIPLVPKFNVLFPTKAVFDIQSHCDAVCISNTIPYGLLPDKVPWGKYFGRDYELCGLSSFDRSFEESPLLKRGFTAGGLSGAPLLPLVAEWVKEAREGGVVVPINAGGGILKPKDVDVLKDAGADSVFLGSIGILRGWRLASTIRRAWRVLGGSA